MVESVFKELEKTRNHAGIKIQMQLIGNVSLLASLGGGNILFNLALFEYLQILTYLNIDINRNAKNTLKQVPPAFAEVQN